MNPLDWALAVLLTYSVVRAAFRGFVCEAFALGGLIAGFLLACWGYRWLAIKFAGLINSPQTAQFLAFVLLLIGVMIAATLLGSVIKRGASMIGLGFFDRLLGAIFGLLRGAVLAGGLLLSITAFLPTASWMQTSLLAPYLFRAIHVVSFVMPSDLRSKLNEGVSHIKHTSAGWIKSGR